MDEKRRKISANELIEEYQSGKRDFSGIVLKHANLEGTYFEGADFSNSDLSGTSFARSNLTNADFSGCNLQRCVFEGATLFHTAFDNSDMQWSILKNAFFDKTSLKKCKLSFAHLCKDDLAKADLSGADLSMVCLINSNITPEQLNQIPSEIQWTIAFKGEHPDTVKAGESGVASSSVKYGQISSRSPAYGAATDQLSATIYKTGSSAASYQTTSTATPSPQRGESAPTYATGEAPPSNDPHGSHPSAKQPEYTQTGPTAKLDLANPALNPTLLRKNLLR